MNLLKYSKKLSNLDLVFETLIQAVNKQNLDNIAASKWTVKDVLCHVVFWHRYYAQQYSDLAHSKKPFIFPSRGGSIRNQSGVDSLKHESKNQLIKMLLEAQKVLSLSILENNILKMHYTDRRVYETGEFLEIITRHIKRHTEQIVKAKN
jgi:hypothetical protein